MLKSLYIKNYALIEELKVEFERGLNIITGETGAGKSIIIDALSLILGDRADSDSIRKGADKAIVEGVFDSANNKNLISLLKNNEIDSMDDLILRREISTKGQSRCFINDSPVTLNVLKDIGNLLVDLHGQHQHQSLLNIETHIELLDGFGRFEGLVKEYSEEFLQAKMSISSLKELQAKEAQLCEKQSLYEFQIKEIDAVDPKQGEEEALKNELRILENSEKLFSATERLYQILYDGENAIHDMLVIARNELENLSSIDKSFEEPKGEAASATAIVDELAKFIQQYNSRIEFNPSRLEEIRNRLGNLTLLKKKYGGTFDSLISHRGKIGIEYELAANFENEIEILKKEFNKRRRTLSEIAIRLSEKRHDVAKKLNKLVVESLKELGISNGIFETMLRTREDSKTDEALIHSGKDALEATENGMDFVEFYISTNVGEEPKPLVKVASGGEISRIMLAMKMILAKSDRLPLLIFDEIDVGISGRIAQSVGQAMKKLSQFHQIIAITHLPQIAGFADIHFVVEKKENAKRALTQMRRLNDKERIREVAKLISGESITESGLESARELIGVNQN